MAAMAGAAGHRNAGTVDLSQITSVDILSHCVHRASDPLHWLGVCGEIEKRATIGTDVPAVLRMTRVTLSAQCCFPLLHDVVNLISRQVPGQHLQVCGRRICEGRRRCADCRFLHASWSLCSRCDDKGCRNHQSGCGRRRKQQERWLHGGIWSGFGALCRGALALVLLPR